MSRSAKAVVPNLIAEASELGILPRVARFIRVLTVTPEHPVARRWAEAAIQNERIRRNLIGNPLDPSPSRFPGSIRLGRSGRRPVFAPLAALLGNLICAGGTGAGKTNLELILIPQLAACGLCVWVFELFKADLKRVRHLMTRSGSDLVLFTALESPFNTFEVPTEVQPRTWLRRIIDILRDALHLPVVAADLLMQTLIRLYQQRGVFEGSGRFPTLNEIIADIRSAQTDAHPQARSALLSRLELLRLEMGPRLANCRRGFDIAELAARNVYDDLHPAGPMLQRLIPLYWITALFEYRLATGRPNQDIQNAIFLEEAQHFLGSDEGGTSIVRLFSQVRGAGISILAWVQTSRIADAVLSNTAVKLLARAGHARDYAAFGACMGLSAHVIEWLKWNARPGTFVCKLSDGEILRPFLFQATLVPPLPAVTPADIRASQRQLDWTAVEFADSDSTPSSGDVPVGHDAGPAAPDLTEFERSVLRTIAAHPLMPSSRFASRLGISMRRSIAIRRRLVDVGAVTERRLDAGGRRGGTAIVMELTDAGRELSETA
ncbi:MAG: hypothetical protein V3T70_03210 [Phycisphaerae bacterium]